ncbi:HAD-IA family hydrolase [Amorphus coralli]|uniref:HAD-IA family hydrolase n=1 Tax=Amorphus coralli TaxID=340680 RepID=UPI0003745D2F|nr:HAD-IA family hydrolase [Amorphus coralli]
MTLSEIPDVAVSPRSDGGPRLVLFDCDGTLVDSQHIIVAAMERAFVAERLPVPPRSAILGIVGLSLPQAIGQLVGPDFAGSVPTVVEAYKDSFRDLRSEAIHHEPLFPDVDSVLAGYVARDDVLLGLVTGKSRRGVDVIVERFGFHGHFVTIQTADDAPSKPHPQMILNALAETGAEPAAAVMIGDTTFDMQMAKAAGVAALGVSWGYHPVETLAPAGADAVVDRAADIPDAVASLVSLERTAP